LTEVLVQTLTGLLVAAIGFVSARAVDRFKRYQRYGHLYDLIPSRSPVQIVLPSFVGIQEFYIPHVDATARIPPNNLVMPMNEAWAIAELVMGIRRVNKTSEITLGTARTYKDNNSLTICIGGPSVNQITRQVLKSVPNFSIDYPQHEAHFGSTTFIPARNDQDELVEDYGFVYITHTHSGGRHVVLCGVWSPGTEMAAKCLLGLHRRSDAVGMIKRRENVFLVAHGEVNGVETSNVKLIETRRP
jgi:hypothetical protein